MRVNEALSPELTESLRDTLGVVVVATRRLAAFQQPLEEDVFGADEEQDEFRRADLSEVGARKK